MDPAFWASRWQEGRIGFHEGRPNTFLQRHHGHLAGCRRVLVPLCGKTEDLAFLASQGHEVVGVELVEDAVRAFFAEHGVTPEVTRAATTAGDAFAVYRADRITLLAGDVLATTLELLGGFDGIYDRAALIALPPPLRTRYVAHLRSLAAPGTRALVITLEYPQEAMPGPPFAVLEPELRAHYAGATLALVDEAPDARVREGAPPMQERCYALTL